MLCWVAHSLIAGQVGLGYVLVWLSVPEFHYQRSLPDLSRGTVLPLSFHLFANLLHSGHCGNPIVSLLA